MTDTPEDLCEDEGCPHHGTPHVCRSVPPTTDRVLGFNFISTPGMRDDMIIALDPGGADYTGVTWQRRPTLEEEAERAERIRRMGETIQYPVTQTVQMTNRRGQEMGRILRSQEEPRPPVEIVDVVDQPIRRIGFAQRILRRAAETRGMEVAGTITGRTASRHPPESNPPREGEPSLLERIADPAYPLPPIQHVDYVGLLRPIQNAGVQAQAAAAAMQRLHEQMRALAAEFPNIEVNGDMVIVNNDAQPITQEAMADALRRVTAEPTAEERERRRMERVLTFGSRYGMGRSRLMEVDYAALEARMATYIDTEGSLSLDSLAAFYGGAGGLFGNGKAPKLVKPPKGSLLKLPSKKAPMGHTFAVIKIEETTHILGTVPAHGSLTGDIDRIVRFPVQVKMSFKRNEPQHTIPGNNVAEGRVIMLKDILAPQKKTRGTILHDEWHGAVRAVLFQNEAVAKSVRGFRVYKG